ncbi:heavy metal-associated isoprenylated plant protein 47 isoform X2 [Cajanus cajan]|uniref:heavy metal-associated isoprenylated plant protein 47 isoform X2 n=1 Tax=Cajanus cajan TaxID=3821 RepID=UPI00098DC3BE|nr:heavy metal-associated isoprenylated plant protein 47 isoform X2 [Cajanus cajan]
MKQKIVIQLEMDCDKCRNKALKIAAEVPGVSSVSLDGDDKDRVAATGENVDLVCLANQLKKKFRSVIIVSVEDMKKTAEEKKKKDEEEKKKKEELELKRQEKEEKLKKLLHIALCKKCKSSSCHGHS